jgi:hypothetical protein
MRAADDWRAAERGNEMSLEHAPERQRGQRKLWRFKDLKAAGIVNSPMTVKRLIDSGRLAPGRLITPNARAWTDEEIEALIASAPTARKLVPRLTREVREGRDAENARETAHTRRRANKSAAGRVGVGGHGHCAAHLRRKE